MQSQMSGKSLDELVALKNDLGEHGDIIGDSMQVMSDPDVKFPWWWTSRSRIRFRPESTPTR